MIALTATLYPQKDFLFVHKIQEAPFQQYKGYRHHHNIIGTTGQLSCPFKKCIVAKVPVNEFARHIDKNGVHANYFKEEGPLLVAAHINDIVKNSQQCKAVATGI